MQPDKSHAIDEEVFARLAMRYLEGTAGEVERQQFAEVLKQSPPLITEFISLARQHGLLSEVLSAPGTMPVQRHEARKKPMLRTRRTTVRRRPVIWAIAAGLLVLLGVAFSFWPVDAGIGIVESGSLARLERAGQTVAGPLMRVGDRIISEGSAVVKLDDGSRLSFGAGSIAEVRGAKHISLTQGEVDVHAVTQAAQAPLVVDSPAAEARVVGTWFTFHVAGESARLSVHEGQVQFVRRQDGASLVVPAHSWAAVAGGVDFRIQPTVTPVTPVAVLAVPTPGPELQRADPFVCGVNLNGEAVVVEGHSWWSQNEAVTKGLLLPNIIFPFTTTVSPQPPVEPDMSSMLNTAICVASGHELAIGLPLPVGIYQVELWLIENYADRYRSLTITLEDTVVAQGVQAEDHVGQWHRLGYPVEVRDGHLDIVLTSTPNSEPHLMGFSVRRR